MKCVRGIIDRDEPSGVVDPNLAPWYTNPQTVAFCDMLGLENKVNPVPTGMNLPPVSQVNPT
jgi:hypothetical protein